MTYSTSMTIVWAGQGNWCWVIYAGCWREIGEVADES